MGSPSSHVRQPLLRSPEEARISSHDQVHRNDVTGADDDDEQAESKHVQRWQHQGTFKLIAVIFDFFMMGVLQTAVGALVPDIERFYHLKDGPTASIFVVQLAGYLCAAATIQRIHLRLGRRAIALFSPLLRLAAAALLATGAPFHMTLPMYCLLGFGVGLADGSWCAWVTGPPYASVCQGMMHGAFSLGCIVGPISALAVLKSGNNWYSFYIFAVSLPALPLLPNRLLMTHGRHLSCSFNWLLRLWLFAVTMLQITG